MNTELKLSGFQLAESFTNAGVWISSGAFLGSIFGLAGIEVLQRQETLLAPDIAVLFASAGISCTLQVLDHRINSIINKLKTNANQRSNN